VSVAPSAPDPIDADDVGPAASRAPRVDGPDLDGLLAFWDQSVDLFAILGREATFLDVNPAWTRVLGWSRDELLEMGPVALVHPGDVERTLAAASAHATPESALQGFESRFRAKDGGYRLLRWSGRMGREGRAYTVARDITERREQEALVHESEERFRLAMAHAAIGMAIVGLDGRWVEVNDALCSMLGRSREELTALTFQDLTHPDDLDMDLEQAEALAAGDIDHYHLEKRYLRPDGTVVWGLLAGSAVRDGTGAPIYYLAQVQDVTPQKEAQAKLRETVTALRHSNEMLTEFAAVAAHELKSPLVAAVSLLELLHMRTGGQLSTQDRELLDRAHGRLRQLAAQVDGLLRIAAVSGMPIDLAEQDVCAILRTVIDDLGELGQGLDVTAAPCARVRADPSALALLLRNLVKNAADHGASHLRVHAEHVADGMVAVCVDDDGPGIPPTQRERALELFGAGVASTGVGVGLATCQRIVERHGGKLDLDDAPEGGLRVRLTLPAGEGRPGEGTGGELPARRGARGGSS
jgi:PAS domain S-box-containing protein